MSPLEITLIILLCTIFAFYFRRIHFPFISSGIVLALIFTGVMGPAEALSGFINTNVVMFVAMFVIGAGLTKTSLLDRAQSVVVRYKDNLPVLIFFSSLVAAFLGCVTSATATAAIMIPLLVGIASEIGVSRSKLLFPTMAICQYCDGYDILRAGRQQYDLERSNGESRWPASIWRMGFYDCSDSDSDRFHHLYGIHRLQIDARHRQQPVP